MPVRTLSKQLQEKASRELNEIPEETQRHIDDLKQWLAERPCLKSRTDDQWLLGFLRGCKFNLQKTREKLEYLHVMKTRAPEFCQNKDPLLPEIQDILNRGIILPVKNTVDPAGPTLLLVRWEKADPKTNSFVDMSKVGLMLLDILINESDSFVIAGAHIFEDFQGFSPRYLMQFTPGASYKCAQFIQSVYPIRVKGGHFINVPSYFRIIYNLLNMLLNKKLRSRVNVYPSDGFHDDGNLLKDIPWAIFPKEYGGKADSVEKLTAEWKKKVESYREWFLQESC